MANVSRSTLLHLENGKDVQASTLLQVASVLGAKVGLLDERSDLVARRLARYDQTSKEQRVREQHLKLAGRLAVDSVAAKTMIKDAFEMINLWEDGKTCSPFYIDSWRSILKGTRFDVAKKLLSLDRKWESALLQNSPFVTQDS
jgi:transcriptional regulator with XRE-family HTH domain